MSLLPIGDAAADGGGVFEAQLAPHPCFHSREMRRNPTTSSMTCRLWWNCQVPKMKTKCPSSGADVAKAFQLQVRACQCMSVHAQIQRLVDAAPCNAGNVNMCFGCGRCHLAARSHDRRALVQTSACVHAPATQNTTLTQHSLLSFV